MSTLAGRKSMLLVLIIAACYAPAAAQEQRAPVPLNKWRVTKAGIEARTSDHRLTVSQSGRIETDVEYLDFVLRLKFRAMTPDADGALVLRAWENYWGARTGYRLPISASPAKAPGELVTGLSGKTHVVSATTDVAFPVMVVGEWRQLEVACEHDRLTIRVDGREIGVVEGSEPQAGAIAIESKKGVIEYDEISLTPYDIPVGHLPQSVTANIVSTKAPPAGLRLPRVAREVRPRYTPGAMRAKVQGRAVVEVVITATGEVAEVAITRSLHSDLDVEAVAAARRWRFEPAMLNGTPVPVVATIELTFTLR